MAQCGLWHKMEKKLVDIQNCGPDLCEISEATVASQGRWYMLRLIKCLPKFLLEGLLLNLVKNCPEPGFVSWGAIFE